MAASVNFHCSFLYTEAVGSQATAALHSTWDGQCVLFNTLERGEARGECRHRMLSVMKISWMVQRLMQERLMPRRWTLYAMALSLRWHLVMQRAYVACPMKKTHGHWRVKSSQHRSQKRNTRGFSLVLHIAQDWLTALHALSDSVIYIDNYHDSPAPVHDESQSKYAAQLLYMMNHSQSMQPSSCT